MKPCFLGVIVIFLCVTLWGCGSEIRGDDHGTQYTINKLDQSITYGNLRYDYEYNENSRMITLSHNGNVQYYRMEGQGIVGSGDTLGTSNVAFVLYKELNKNKRCGENLLLGSIFIILGFINWAEPALAWHLSEGWKYRDVEPSDTALAMTRVGGIIGVIVGIIFVIMFFSGAGSIFSS